MGNQGFLVAYDNSIDRLALVEENCRRLGVTCAKMVENPEKLRLSGTTLFDRVLIDAPCSNTGVLRRRVDLRWRVTLEEVERLRVAQLSLLRQGLALLRPGGTLVYSTCSLEPEENSELVNQFLNERTEVERVREQELFPPHDNADGAYVATLRRNG
jgi:16S rRNA (cytosine967-C5)-methyltransferase